MPLNKCRGQMYSWVTHTHNHLGGECPHRCSYCSTRVLEERYGLKKYTGPVRFVEEESRVKYGEGKTIFVENCSDLFAWDVPGAFIHRVLDHCKAWPKNKYVFQTKNPGRLGYFLEALPQEHLLGTTIETNRDTSAISKAPPPEARYEAMKTFEGPRFVTLEPILDFDGDVLSSWLIKIRPSFVNIGADSKGHGLKEPDPKKIMALIGDLKNQGIRVNVKTNLKRLVEA